MKISFMFLVVFWTIAGGIYLYNMYAIFNGIKKSHPSQLSNPDGFLTDLSNARFLKDILIPNEMPAEVVAPYKKKIFMARVAGAICLICFFLAVIASIDMNG